MQLTDTLAEALYQAAKTLVSQGQSGTTMYRALKSEFCQHGWSINDVQQHFEQFIKPRLEFNESPKKSHLPQSRVTRSSPVQQQTTPVMRTPQKSLRKSPVNKSPLEEDKEVIEIDEDSFVMGEIVKTSSPLKFKEVISSSSKIIKKPYQTPQKQSDRKQKLQFEIRKIAEEFNTTTQKVLLALYQCNGSLDLTKSYLLHQKNRTEDILRDKIFTKRDDALIILHIDKYGKNDYQRHIYNTKDLEKYCQDSQYVREHNLQVYQAQDDYDEQYWNVTQMAEVKSQPVVTARQQFLKEFEKAAVVKMLE